jgi:hypothetical protein
MNKTNSIILRLVLLISAIVVPFIAWGSYYGWNFSKFTIYQIYPILGITAFMIMATHFYISAIDTKIKIYNHKLLSNINYIIVLTLILLHPMLLYYRLFNDGLGLPPFSSIEFVGESLAIFVFLGSFGLILFLLYELVRHFKNKNIIANNWLWVIISQYVAMFAIFVHARGLGGITQIGWFKLVWLVTFLGVLLSAFYIIPAEINKKLKK